MGKQKCLNTCPYTANLLIHTHAYIHTHTFGSTHRMKKRHVLLSVAVNDAEMVSSRTCQVWKKNKFWSFWRLSGRYLVAFALFVDCGGFLLLVGPTRFLMAFLGSWKGLGRRIQLSCRYVCMYVSMYVCVYVSMHACMYVCMLLCMYVSMHVKMFVCMYACMYVRTYVCICMHARKHAYACTNT